mmetsp:Transcript_2770/g.7609  ORF Transcript_2770/g.7609 Transcript_2770/m.7609 type:complete len:82 (+) Transcript_2770:643-888(+)
MDNDDDITDNNTWRVSVCVYACECRMYTDSQCECDGAKLDVVHITTYARDVCTVACAPLRVICSLASRAVRNSTATQLDEQ